MNTPPLVLVIEDDAAIRKLVRNVLGDVDCQLEETASCEGGLSLCASLHPDLVILDLGLPDGDGVDLIGRIRSFSDLPVIVISGRDKEAEKVRALEAGADDYVTKPFGLNEFRARVRVALRRNPLAKTKGTLTFAQLRVDLDARRLYLGEQEVHLTPLEYRLFSVFISHPGKILTTRYLLREVWGIEMDSQKHYVRVLTAGLRKKLEPDPDRPIFIHTETGVGYRFFE